MKRNRFTVEAIIRMLRVAELDLSPTILLWDCISTGSRGEDECGGTREHF